MKLRHILIGSVLLFVSACTHDIPLRQSEEDRLAAGGAPRTTIQQDTSPKTIHPGGPPVLMTDAEFAIWQKEFGPQEAAPAVGSVTRFLELMEDSRPITVRCKTRTFYSKKTARYETTCY